MKTKLSLSVIWMQLQEFKLLMLVIVLFSGIAAHAQYTPVMAGTISTNNNTTICIDGIPDPIDFQVTGATGNILKWVITDANNTILSLPDSPPPFDFEPSGPGVCRVWHLSLAFDFRFIKVGRQLYTGNNYFYSVSNYIEIIRNQPEGGGLTGGPFTFTVGDGVADNIPDGEIVLSGNVGENSQWVVTDSEGNILGLPPSPYAVDFDGAGEGTCLVWHLSFDGEIQGAAMGNNAANLEGCYSLSNPIEVVRNTIVAGGTLEGGPFEFCVGDEVADNIPDGAITLSGNVGENSQWVVTDSEGNILGLPPSPYVVDFDGAGDGTCLVWHLSFNGEIGGAAAGNNAADLTGDYSLSNPISVIRNQPEGGTLEGGPFTFTVGDGEADNIPDGAITLSGNVGENSQWVVTDSEGNILGLPPSPYVVDFDGAGEGTCLVWHLSFDGDVQGTAMGNNAANLEGCYSLSNPIEVYRNNAEVCDVNGGHITPGGLYFFCEGDGIPDYATGITLNNNSGANSQWVVTDVQGNILGLPPTPDVVDFDGAGPGICLIWHLSFDTIEGAAMGNNAFSDLSGCYNLSNPIPVFRFPADGFICQLLSYLKVEEPVEIKMYPNPATDTVNIDLQNFKEKNVTIKIYDFSNIELYNKSFETSINKKAAQIDVSKLNQGFYLLSIANDNGDIIAVKRLVIK